MPLLLGHRGAKKYAPENTAEAFALALDHGCDGFEFDVRLTANGGAVCCHDPEYRGHIVCQCQCNFEIADLTRLEAALGFADRGYLDIEMKVAGVVPKFATLLHQLDPERTVISSFLPQVISECKQHTPGVPAGLICESHAQLDNFEPSGADVLIVHHRLVTSELVASTHAQQKRIFVWTVNDAENMRELARLRVDAIISDDTLLMARTLKDIAAAAHA